MKTNIRFWGITLLSILVISTVLNCSPKVGKAQSPDIPAWVNNPSEQFSKERFLMAVGSATTRQGAKDMAQGNLAKIFVSKVKVDQTSIEKFKEITTSEDGESETRTRGESQLITQTDVGSDQQLKNVQIKEVYAAENGTFYALAVMNRTETAQLYTEEINRNNEMIKSLRKNANQTDSKLERLIYMKQALTAARVNDMLINQRSILTGQTSQTEGPQLSEVTQEYRQVKKECTVKLKGEKIPRQIKSVISRRLQNEGFIVAADAKEPIVEINLNLNIKPLDLNRPNTEFMQWALQVEAQNKETGQWFSTYTAEGRNGSINKQRARKLALQAVKENINSEFSEFINSELLSVR